MPGADWSTKPLGDELGEALRAELLGWPAVHVRRVMGTVAFYRNRYMLGCYINRELFRKAQKPSWANRPGEPPLVWVRLRSADAEHALKRPGVRRQGVSFARWVEIPLASRASLAEAVRWLGCAYERPARTQPKRRRTRNPR